MEQIQQLISKTAKEAEQNFQKKYFRVNNQK